MDPISSLVIKLPIRMNIRLLHGVVGAHAQVDRDDVGLNIREMVRGTRKVDRVSVYSKDVTGNVIATPHFLQLGGIRRQNRAKLYMAICAWRRIHIRNGEVVDHPTFVPTAFVVNDKHWVDVGKNVDEGTRIVGISRKSGFGFQHDTNCADSGQTAIRPGNRQLHVVIDTRKDCGEYVWLKTRSI